MKVKQITVWRKINSMRVNTSENKRQRQKTRLRHLEPKHLVHGIFSTPMAPSWKISVRQGMGYDFPSDDCLGALL